MTTFTKFTALAVAALVMASTSAMAITESAVSRTFQSPSNMPEIYGINGPIRTSPLGTQNYLTGLGGISRTAYGISRTAQGFATAGNALGNIGNGVGAAGAGIAYTPNFNTQDEFGSSTNYIQGYRAGVGSVAQSMRTSATSGGGLLGGSLGSISRVGNVGANIGTGGISGALGNLSGGLRTLGYNLNTIGNIAGVDLGGRTLMNSGGYANIAGGLTNGQNWTNLGNNLETAGTNLVTGINRSGQYFEAAGSALSRRAPVTGATTTITHEAAHGATTPTPAPTQGFVGPPS